MGANDVGTTTPHMQDGGAIDRRRFLAGASAAGVVGAAATVGAASPALAGHTPNHHGRGGQVFGAGPAPEPIPASVPTAEDGFNPPPPFDVIHWLLPGPPGATTQILNLPAFGLDVDPSLITNFDGFTAYAVIAGDARGADGTRFDCEFDVRVMQGRYRVDGEEHHGTFGFF